MQLLDHVSIAVPDLDAARPFYDGVMAALGADKVYDRSDALGYGVRCSAQETAHSCLAVYASPLTSLDARRHWCFKAPSRAAVRAFHAAGLAHGGRDDGAPGLRPHIPTTTGPSCSTPPATASRRSAMRRRQRAAIEPVGP